MFKYSPQQKGLSTSRVKLIYLITYATFDKMFRRTSKSL